MQRRYFDLLCGPSDLCGEMWAIRRTAILTLTDRDSTIRGEKGKMLPIVTLTTDFGQADVYVGVIKGVILSIAPNVTLVDLSHEIEPQNVREAAFLLYAATPYFPDGTIHLTVVDPGVGSERRALAVRTRRAIFVVPDNGLLSYVLATDPALEAVQLVNPRFHLAEVSSTFHGRDIFAPVAAHLAKGVPLADLGEVAADLVTFPMPSPAHTSEGTLQSHVLHIDRFGNLILDVRQDDLDNLVIEPSHLQSPIPNLQRGNARHLDNLVIEVGGQTISRLSRTYADGRPGQLVAYVGSTRHHLEIAMREGDAARSLSISVGEPVTLYIT
jgi:S-adenosylmethionine hydrolase